MDQLAQEILRILTANPNLAIVMTIMTVSRAIFKPLMTVIAAYVEATPSKDDDSKFAAFKASKAYAVISWVLDFSLSIKLPQVDAEKK